MSTPTPSLKEKTIQGLFWGGFSIGLQQLLNLVFGIWISRILDASDYGIIGVLTIFTLIATTLQESGFTQAIANKKDATLKDFNSIFWCSSFIGISLYVILFFAAPLITAFFNMPELTKLSRFLFIGFVLSSFGTAYNAYLFKHLMVRQKAISTLTGLFISGIVGVTLAYSGYAYWGLAAQHITYVFVTNFLFFYFSKWTPKLEFSFHSIKELIPFSSRILITKICNHINNHVLNLIIGRFFTQTEVGFYSQSNKWNLMGSSIITEMVHGVSQPVLRKVDKEKERQKNIFLKLLRFTSFAAFPLLFGLAYIAPEFIEIALTSKWLPSAILLQILCIGGAFLPINNLLSNLLISSGKSSQYMWITVITGGIQVVLALILYPYGIKNMVIGVVVIQVSTTLMWFSFAKRGLSITFYEFFKDIIPYATAMVISVGLCYYILPSGMNVYLSIIAKVGIVGATYIALLIVFKSSILMECYQTIRKRSAKS